MKKVLIALLSIGIAFAAIQPAQAQDQKVLAIIDTAIDSNRVSSVIYEACFTDSLSMPCPNKQKFMEGKGSANSPVWPQSMTSGLYHGHNITQAAIAVNPDLKIVFVRVYGVTSSGGFSTTPKNVVEAINWVSKNASKYSIDAVSVSQSFTSKSILLSCKTDTMAINSVSTLSNENIPVFVATGNDRFNDKVGFPACVDGVIGVGSITPKLDMFAASTNRGPGLDVVSVGSADIVRYNGTIATIAGTSVSTPIAASLYIKNAKNNFSTFVSGLAKFLTYPIIN